jgi:hypothetical protein
MDTGITAKLNPNVVARDPVPTHLASAGATATELPAAKAVAPATDATAVRNAAQDNYQRTAVLDPATREVIYRVIDVRSRQVVRQVPEEALLRMRAYARALAAGKSVNDALAQADLQA